jgi:AGZA family xanthine/uracil permease-like MFS transporter
MTFGSLTLYAGGPVHMSSGILERLFKLREHGTNVPTELLGGVTTFVTMAYIIFVNPSILGDAGMPQDAVFVATCLAAAIGSLVMAFYANYPIGMAPGMGLNAYFAYVVVLNMGYTWQTALGAVFVAGILFFIVTAIGLREMIIRAIPNGLRVGITAGIGMFLAIIAVKNAGIITASPATLVTLGDMSNPHAILAVIGFAIIAALTVLQVRAALLIGILVVTVLSFFFADNTFNGIVSLPPSIAPTFLALDLSNIFSASFAHVVMVFFLVALFDATGTLMGVAQQAGLMKPSEEHRFSKALMADSSAIVAGAVLGTSPTTAYLESASGVQAGGRTGLVAVFVALLFLLSLFFAPLAGSVPGYATAPALFLVACLMMRPFASLEWDDMTEVIPACVTALLMPFTYSIADGIAFGIISYAGIKLLTGRARDVHPILWVVAVLFLFKLAFGG